MKTYSIFYNQHLVAADIKMANTFLKRLVGLLRTKDLKDNEGLVICPCSQVHTFGMKYDIDVVHLSDTGEILHIEARFPPNRVGRNIRNCKKVLELKSGTADIYGFGTGKVLNIVPNE